MTNNSKNQSENTTKSTSHFHQRFNIEVQDREAKLRFLNRVKNQVEDSFFYWYLESKDAKMKNLKDDILWEIANKLGKKFNYGYNLTEYVEGDFHNCLHAIEVIYQHTILF